MVAVDVPFVALVAFLAAAFAAFSLAMARVIGTETEFDIGVVVKQKLCGLSVTN